MVTLRGVALQEDKFKDQREKLEVRPSCLENLTLVFYINSIFRTAEQQLDFQF